ncbi:hypothetical protein CEUSTIGMA_g2435.t1 [Chlamydomonas eustigma]|uniref:DNA 3'-5' helicase n=1 Tax=Chlamydomonas eustigma TaxID=1157962 RepID=A0A250WWA4_9CHLO|nr:hypothetical protein CEUSTIGMA_g2435.t1 [Chlamydomonas eustigma]|eukprot:GAX74989.1 hypothetical protein CEUSTIGMA_g2435.t1 [Chlamydomonas eustigma]
MSDLSSPPKKIKLSIPKAQPSASTASYKTEQKDNTSQHGPRVSSIKIVKKEERSPSSFIKQELSNSYSTVENSKRSRKSKVKLDDDYDYEQDDMASTEAFGAEDYAFDPDELQDFDDDYDVLGKPRKTKTKKQASSTAQTTEFEMQEVDSNFRYLQLKPDHVNRPLWVTPDGRVFLETFSPIYKQAYDFMIAIAEPVCRPEFIHEYQLTPHSLYAAVSVGLETETIISVLNRLSKVQLGEEVKTFIRSSTQNYGKVKLVLKRNKFYVESPYPEVLKELMKDSVISKARLEGEEGVLVVSKALKERAAARIAEVQDIDLTAPQQNSDDEDQTVTELQSTQQQPASSSATATTMAGSTLTTTGIRKSLFDELGEGVEEDPEKVVLAFEIKPDQVEHVKARCLPGGLNYPMLEEYDFKHDTHNADLAVELKPHVKLRPYQEKSLSKMFGNGRGRSGIIVLPCGAGKSLVGVAAATRIKKSCLCLCTSSVSVDQWRHQFLLWTSLQEHQVSRFTSESKEVFAGLAGICITTFTMVAFSGKRSEESEKVMQMIKEREWGLLLMDEVHVVPAQMFRKVISIVHSHCKLGLTATLVREDERIGDLNFLIGPKLYEANWLDLTRAGHIANVQCAEVWCPMTKEFYSEYLKKENGPRRQLLYVMNPNKFRACQFLINFHEGQRGDKVIVFSDNIWALREYATLLGKPFIYGPTGHAERTRVLHAFKHDPNVNTVFLSKVGDNSLDIPEANVLIQISSHAGSRRQEAQRLGRILRAKQGKAGSGQEGEFNAFFYTLVSRDTQEMYYSTKRQQFLIDQGYSFKVITNLLEAAEESQLAQGHFTTQKQQLDLLSRVLVAGLEEAGVEVLGDKDGDTLAAVKAGGARRRRDAGSMAALSGASGMSYLEYSRAGGGRGFGGGRWGGGRSSGPYQGEKAKALSRKLLGIK